MNRLEQLATALAALDMQTFQLLAHGAGDSAEVVFLKALADDIERGFTTTLANRSVGHNFPHLQPHIDAALAKVRDRTVQNLLKSVSSLTADVVAATLMLDLTQIPDYCAAHGLTLDGGMVRAGQGLGEAGRGGGMDMDEIMQFVDTAERVV